MSYVSIKETSEVSFETRHHEERLEWMRVFQTVYTANRANERVSAETKLNVGKSMRLQAVEDAILDKLGINIEVPC